MDPDQKRTARVAMTELVLIFGGWGLAIASIIVFFNGSRATAGFCALLAVLLFSLHARSARRHPAADQLRPWSDDRS